MEYECKICGLDNKNGINLLGKKICKRCLDKITYTDIDNTLHYEYYKSNIKEMWIDYIGNLEAEN